MHEWKTFILQLENELGNEAFANWVKPIKVREFDAGNLHLELQDSFHEHWFEEYIRPKLDKDFVNKNGRPIKVHVHTKTKERTGEKKEDTSEHRLIQSNPLDPSLNFDTFFVATNNSLSLQILKNLSEESFNPCYIYGKNGAGKTHLLHALALQLRNAGKRVFYASTETFTSHVVHAIRLGKMENFRNAYRNTDVLIIDNVHELSKRFATQEEFFHTFNALHSTNRQVILSGNAPAISLQGIEQRLISRFEWGISLEIAPLIVEDFLPMAKNRCKSLHLPVDEESLTWICTHFTSAASVSRAILALALRYQSGELSLEIVKHCLDDLAKKETVHIVTSKQIIEEVSKHFGIRIEDIYSQNKSREFSLPRQVAIYLCRMKLKEPYMKIGKLLGRDHSTILTSVKSIQKSIEKKNFDILQSLREIEKKLH